LSTGGASKMIKPLDFFSVTVFCLNNIIRISTAHSFGLILYFASMSKLKSKDLPTSLTLLGILIIAFSDKIEELTSIPFLIITAIAFILLFIPLYIWISNWLKSRK
jgi:Flp pilus assembly protein protease CpaA